MVRCEIAFGSGKVSAAYKLEVKSFNEGVSRVLTLRPLTEALHEVSQKAASSFSSSGGRQNETLKRREGSSQVNGEVVKRK
jgi:hypothetical protein